MLPKNNLPYANLVSFILACFPLLPLTSIISPIVSSLLTPNFNYNFTMFKDRFIVLYKIIKILIIFIVK